MRSSGTASVATPSGWTLIGTSGNETVKAGSGNDVIVTNGGSDHVDGGAGFDQIGVNGNTTWSANFTHVEMANMHNGESETLTINAADPVAITALFFAVIFARTDRFLTLFPRPVLWSVWALTAALILGLVVAWMGAGRRVKRGRRLPAV